MSPAIPIPAEVRAEVLRLAREGVARNEIARRVEVSSASVTRICAGEEGISFDRSATAVAVRARAVDLKAARLGLAGDLLEDVGEARARMHAGEDSRAFLDGARAVAALVGSHVRVAAVDKDDTSGVDTAKSMLGRLASALGAAVTEDGPDEDGEDA
ncbi:hypothetical protein ACIF80_09600 [Streptomyces sp. NPDC085927]|uniref:hypothetical protein n=1 Tax=Streptomyces sp. NPDC085927 TaxID=3365738 RepID=UPI0037D8915B